MASTHHHSRYTAPQQSSQNERRLPSIKDLNFQYRSPQGSSVTQPELPTQEYPATPRHSSAWSSRSVPISSQAVQQHHHQQHTPPLSAGHDVPKDQDYPSKQENGGYVHPGIPLSAQVAPLPGAVNIGNPRGDDSPHSPNQLKRSRTTSNVPVPRDIRQSHVIFNFLPVFYSLTIVRHISRNMRLTPLPPSLRPPTLIRQFPQVYPDSHPMPHILRPTNRCSNIPWPFPPILDMLPTSMRTYKPVSPSCILSILHSRPIQTHTPLQDLRSPHLLHRVHGVNLILNSSIRRSLRPISYHPLRNSNMPNSHRTINNNPPYPQLLLTWCSIIINPLTKILILPFNTIRFNNNPRLNNNNNSSNSNSNYPLLLEPPLLFQPPLIPVIHMPSMNPTDSP